MIARMLLVLLLVLNLGVAAWWALHRPAPAAPAAAPDAPVPTLELVRAGDAGMPRDATADTGVAIPAEAASANTASVSMAPAAAPATNATAEAPPVCASFGPFADDAAAEAARGQLAVNGVEASLRRTGSTNARGYNVQMRPLGNRDAALAMAGRLGAAGFNDLMVIANGEAANGIALGRFGSEANARRHQAALQAKGFATQVLPIGGAGAFWLDVRAPAGFDADTQRTRIGAAQAQPRACPA